MTTELNIAIVHNKIRQYRLPLFEALSAEYDVKYYIFEENSGNYPLDVIFTNEMELFHEILHESFDVVILPDYVFLEAWIAGVAAKISGSRVVSWTEIWDMPHTPIWKRLIKRSLAFSMGMLADSFIVPGRQSKEFLQIFPHIKDKDIFLAPNAMNLSENEGQMLDKYDINTDKHIILYLGQLIERKRVQDIIRATELLETTTEFELLIGGTGDEKYSDYLKEISNEDTVTFLGWVPDEEIPNLYDSADVYVLPSLQDPYPLTVVEAMACGTPVVISEGVGEAGDIVRQGETGEVVPTKSPENIAKALTRLLEDSKYRTKLAEQGQRAVDENVTYREMMDGIRNAINESAK